jgi:hypothetical protein
MSLPEGVRAILFNRSSTLVAKPGCRAPISSVSIIVRATCGRIKSNVCLARATRPVGVGEPRGTLPAPPPRTAGAPPPGELRRSFGIGASELSGDEGSVMKVQEFDGAQGIEDPLGTMVPAPVIASGAAPGVEPGGGGVVGGGGSFPSPAPFGQSGSPGHWCWGVWLTRPLGSELFTGSLFANA